MGAGVEDCVGEEGVQSYEAFVCWVGQVVAGDVIGGCGADVGGSVVGLVGGGAVGDELVGMAPFPTGEKGYVPCLEEWCQAVFWAEEFNTLQLLADRIVSCFSSGTGTVLALGPARLLFRQLVWPKVLKSQILEINVQNIHFVARSIFR